MPNPIPIPIVVFAGQSNANNTGSIGAIFNGVAGNGGLLVQSAVNGSPLAASDGDDWSAGGGADDGELLRSLMVQLDGILDPASPTFRAGAYLDTVIWSHGGADVYSKADANSYQSNLSDLVAALSQKYGPHDFVISGMADASFVGRELTGQRAQNWQAVKAAQIAVAELPRVHLLDPDAVAQTNGFSANQMFMGDYIHYSTASGFGAVLGHALINVTMPAATPFTATLSTAGYKAGTTGNDNFTVPSTGSTQVWGNEGEDQVTLKATRAGMLLLDQGLETTRITGRDAGSTTHIDLISIETVKLSNGSDEARLDGSVTTIYTLDGKDKVMGSGANETAFLGEGNDYAALLGGNDALYGEGGNDTLLGGYGSDTLFGGTGSDKLTGGAGSDQLTGSWGADQFIFDTHSGTDTITDFQNGSDRIVLNDATFADVSVQMQGMNTVITVGGGTTIILANFAQNLLDINDFIFT